MSPYPGMAFIFPPSWRSNKSWFFLSWAAAVIPVGNILPIYGLRANIGYTSSDGMRRI